MQQGDQFNQQTVGWRNPHAVIETGAAAACAARGEDIETFRRNGEPLRDDRFPVLARAAN